MKSVSTSTIFRPINLILILSFFLNNGFAQNYAQTIRGKITDALTHAPLVGATVSINEKTGVVTNENGYYRLEEVPVGRYQLTVAYLGYETLVLPEILVESGKEVIHNIALEATATKLDEVVIRASRNNYRVSHPLSVKTLTVEETLRFPATFFDPARLATTFAGVVNENDQANGISIRGNSPNGISWRLEGMEIVNPNHTPNAGTFSDRITQNGGGVNILSAQLLGTSNLYTGAFPAGFGNALSGVMDMRLRKGNDEQHEFTIQAGLIGIDLAAEGPISKSGASYLVNYRYSTIGLLSAMGLDLGDEAITFQDLSFHLNFPVADKAEVKIFGLGGQSENIFEAQRDTSLWEFEKDNQDIAFDSQTGAIGGTGTFFLNDKNLIKTGLLFSVLESNRIADELMPDFTMLRLSEDRQTRRKISAYLNFESRISDRSSFLLGLSTSRDKFMLDIQNANTMVFNQGELESSLVNLYTNWRTKLAQNLELNAGLNFSRYSVDESTYIEPRLAMDYRLTSKDRISLAYGLHSQQQTPTLLFNNFNGSGDATIRDLGFTRAHHIVLGYKHNFTATSNLQAEIFYQSLFDVPIAGDRTNAFSAINIIEGFYLGELVNEGTGSNYGLELTYQKYLTDRVYYLLNGTYYESKYKGSDGIERDTRYNGNYIFNLTGGKEWQWLKIKNNGKKRDAILGLNLRLVYLGGFRDAPIDVETSANFNTTIYFEDAGFEISQNAFFRTDLRVYYKRSKARSSSTWALDIQNLTNKENAAFSYYDTYQNAIVTKYQLGIIPILSYRIEF